MALAPLKELRLCVFVWSSFSSEDRIYMAQTSPMTILLIVLGRKMIPTPLGLLQGVIYRACKA